MSINRVCISGHLTRAAEMRYTQGGMAVVGFGVAVNDRRKNQQSGEWEDYPNFVDCTMFGNRAEKLQPYLAKGAKVAVEGKLRYSSWEQGGQRRSKLEVIVDELEFMSRRPDAEREQPAGRPEPAVWPAEMADVDAQYAAIPAQLPSVYDEDVPF